MYQFKVDQYISNQSLCITAYLDGELVGKLSVAIPDVLLEDLEFIAKTYSENASWAMEALKSDYFEDTGCVVYADYVTMPIYKVTPKFIEDQFEATYNKASDMYEAPQFLWDLYEKHCKEPA